MTWLAWINKIVWLELPELLKWMDLMTKVNYIANLTPRVSDVTDIATW